MVLGTCLGGTSVRSLAILDGYNSTVIQLVWGEIRPANIIIYVLLVARGFTVAVLGFCVFPNWDTICPHATDFGGCLAEFDRSLALDVGRKRPQVSPRTQQEAGVLSSGCGLATDDGRAHLRSWAMRVGRSGAEALPRVVIGALFAEHLSSIYFYRRTGTPQPS